VTGRIRRGDLPVVAVVERLDRHPANVRGLGDLDRPPGPLAAELVAQGGWVDGESLGNLIEAYAL